MKKKVKSACEGEWKPRRLKKKGEEDSTSFLFLKRKIKLLQMPVYHSRKISNKKVTSNIMKSQEVSKRSLFDEAHENWIKSSTPSEGTHKHQSVQRQFMIGKQHSKEEGNKDEKILEIRENQLKKQINFLENGCLSGCSKVILVKDKERRFSFQKDGGIADKEKLIYGNNYLKKKRQIGDAPHIAFIQNVASKVKYSMKKKRMKEVPELIPNKLKKTVKSQEQQFYQNFKLEPW